MGRVNRRHIVGPVAGVAVVLSCLALAKRRQETPPAAPEMVLLAGGAFTMGCDDCMLGDAKPQHGVRVGAFWIDTAPVTTAEFATFVAASGYVTVAERAPRAEDYPDAAPEALIAGSAVFVPPAADVSLADPYVWWRYVAGANWRHPEGSGSNIAARAQHPVVHIAYEDAATYCRWAGKRLPREAEYEFAARGGLLNKRYSWGDQLQPAGRWMANIWQGRFPTDNTGEDGYRGTSPVRAFAPNGYGLYDVSGNVWQWCSDWYRSDYYATSLAAGMVTNPTGPTTPYDPQEPDVPKHVQRGGSFLCSEHYCTRYLVAARGKGAADSTSSNLGFRCVRDADPEGAGPSPRH